MLESKLNVNAKLVELTNGNKSFVVTAEYLLELASKAKELFESSQPPQKNKILRALLANLTLNQKKAATQSVAALYWLGV